MKYLPQLRNSQGFTIVELMIATMVFSFVLLMVTAGILQVSRTYYKGITEQSTQNAARSVMDTVAQAIQLGGGTVTTTPGTTPGTSYAFCVGDMQFSYRLGWEVVDGTPNIATHETPHGLVVNNVAGCTSSTPAQNLSVAAVSGRELLSPHMRLAALSVTSTIPDVYRITVRVVYGDNDLLISPSVPASPNPDILSDAKCAGVRAGTQFCSVSELSTVVTKRVE